jgi:hypothetical protein
MTVWNGERFVEEAIRSVLAQSWRPIELIVVDDGSTDGSRDVLRRFEGPEVRVIAVENGGVGRARNLGIEAARGEVVAFLDQDDALTERSLESRVEALLRQPGRFVYGALEWWGPSPDGSTTSPPPDHRPATTYAEAWKKIGITTPGQVIARRADLVSAGGFPDDRAHGGSDDRGMWLRLIANGVTPLNVPDVVLHYRVHPGQTSRTIGFKRARLAMRESLVFGGSPPRRLVPEDEAAPVLAELGLDLAHDLLDVDPREADAVAATARTRCPSIVESDAWRAFEGKRRRKAIGRLPVVGPVLREGWRFLRGPESQLTLAAPPAIPLGRRARWIAAVWIVGVVALYALARLHIFALWGRGFPR